MKNIKILSSAVMLVIFMAICPIADSKPFQTNSTHETIGISSFKNDLSKPGRKNKNGSYKRKKGFMWGLFKKKSSCDCPKH